MTRTLERGSQRIDDLRHPEAITVVYVQHRD